MLESKHVPNQDLTVLQDGLTYDSFTQALSH